MSNFVEKCRKAVQTTDGMEKDAKYTKAEREWITETRDRLAQRRGKRPATKAGQLRALWPEIRAALAEGQSLATICQWLAEEAEIVVTSKASAPTSRASGEKNEVRRSPQLLRRSQSRRKSRFWANRRRCPSALGNRVGSSTLRDLQTKASSSEFASSKIFAFPRPAPPPPFPL